METEKETNVAGIKILEYQMSFLINLKIFILFSPSKEL
jgi:hypothetical protein